jgi:hypothetical protein
MTVANNLGGDMSDPSRKPIMTEPCLLSPDAIYDDLLLRQVLGLHLDQIARARRSGELRHSKRGGRYFYRGDWVIGWLTGDGDESTAGETQQVETLAVGS